MPTKPRSDKPRPPQLSSVPTAPDEDNIQGWDDYVNEAAPTAKPWRKRLPDGEILSVGCPTADQIDSLAEAQGRGDVAAMFVAVFGPEQAPQLLTLTRDQPFTVRVRMINDVMFHYGMSLAQLPNSPASPA